MRSTTGAARALEATILPREPRCARVGAPGSTSSPLSDLDEPPQVILERNGRFAIRQRPPRVVEAAVDDPDRTVRVEVS